MVIILQILLSPTERNQVIILLIINLYDNTENSHVRNQVVIWSPIIILIKNEME